MTINLHYRALREMQEFGIKEGITPPRCFVEEKGLLYYTSWLILLFPIIISIVSYLVLGLQD